MVIGLLSKDVGLRFDLQSEVYLALILFGVYLEILEILVT